MQQPQFPQGEEPLPQVVGHSMLQSYTQAELVDLSSQFRQKPLETMSAWLLCLWDLGVDRIVLSVLEMGKMAS